MSPNKVNTIRYIYTQDPSDDRGLAWTKYVLDYIVNGEQGPEPESGDPKNVAIRIDNVYDRFIKKQENITDNSIEKKENITVRQLFDLPARDNKLSPFANTVVSSFLKQWITYLYFIDNKIISKNKYAKRLYEQAFGENFDSYEPRIKRILSTIFYVGVKDLEPFTDENYNNVDELTEKTTLGKRLRDDEFDSNIIYVNFQFIKDILPFVDLRGKSSDWGRGKQIEKENINNYVWPNLTPEKYFSKLFNSLGDIKLRSAKLEKYDYNANDLSYDKVIKMNKWVKNELNGKIVYKKINDKQQTVNADIDEYFNNNGSNCYNLQLPNPTCNAFITAITQIDDKEANKKLIEFFGTKDNINAFKDLKSTINELHPELALLILKRFDFRINKDNQVVSVGDWLVEYMPKQFPSIQQVIRKQYNLLDFLDYLVRFINYNHKILDPNVEKPLLESDLKNYYFVFSDHEDIGNDLQYHKIHRENNMRSKKTKVNSNIFEMLRTSTNFGDFMPTLTGGYNVNNNDIMYGGNNGTAAEIEAHLAEYPYGYKLMTTYFKNVKSELQRHGKSLDEKDERFIQKQIENLKYYEEDILNKFKNINNYLVNQKRTDKAIGLTESTIARLNNFNKINLVQENYNLQEDQIINALIMALDKLNGNNFNDGLVNEGPIKL